MKQVVYLGMNITSNLFAGRISIRLDIFKLLHPLITNKNV